jgi:hypothetical protein
MSSISVQISLSLIAALLKAHIMKLPRELSLIRDWHGHYRTVNLETSMISLKGRQTNKQ